MTTPISRRTLIAAAAATPLLPSLAMAQDRVGSINRIDAGLDAVIDAKAPIEVIARGYKWMEGPVWIRDGGYLLFTDPAANILYRWKAGEGAKPFLSPSGLQGKVPPEIREPGANGTAIDATGGLILADSGSRCIARVDLKTRKRTVLADRFEGKRFNSCNDVALHRSGAIFFTDPPYGLRDGDESKLKELPFNGVFKRMPDGEVRLVTKALHRPNGIALSPAQDRLYVAQSDEARPEILVWTLDADGTPQGEPRLVHDTRAQLKAKLPGLPDGMKVGRSGHVFATGPGGVHILSPKGKLLGIVSTGKAIANCAFGEDGRTLFLTSTDMVAKVRLRLSGW